MKPKYFAPLLTIFLTVAIALPQAVAYNHYFGTLHSHSAYSDGNKGKNPNYPTAFDAFNFARHNAEMDFMAITDHNHKELGMTKAIYQDALEDALDATATGKFVAIYGIEWGTLNDSASNGGGGHINYYESTRLFGWESGYYDVLVQKGDYKKLFEKILAYPSPYGAIGQVNHPEKDDFDGFFDRYDPGADDAINLFEIRNGPAFSQNTNLGDSGSDYYSRFKEALALGYHVSPTANQDNHYANWGLSSEQRTVVLASKLDRKEIMEALAARRCYASDDMNAKVSFTVNGSIMGSEISTTDKEIKINVDIDDPDRNDNIKTISIYSGEAGTKTSPKIIASKSGVSTFSVNTDNQEDDSEYYYFAEIVQYDNDRIVTGPVWVVKGQDIIDPIDPETPERRGCGFRERNSNSNAASSILLLLFLSAGLFRQKRNNI